MKSYYTLLDAISLEKLKDYGFDSNFVYSFSLVNSFCCIMKYQNNQFFVQVLDQEGEEYLPFSIANFTGKIVSLLREEIDTKIEDIVTYSKIKNALKEKILTYVYDAYGVVPKFPFSKDKVSMTLKNYKNKWFGLIMKVKFSVIGGFSDAYVDILNVKCDSDKIKLLIDNKIYFKAYHMNKKHWITILLTNQTSFVEVKDLLDASYALVS